MSTIPGELGRCAALIGASREDPRVVELLRSPGFREQAPFVDPSSGAEWVVVESVADGLRLQFRDGALAKASAEVAGSAQLDAVAHPEELIVGLDLRTATADDVIERFGPPTKRGRTALQYALDGATLTVAFLDERVRAVTVSDGKR
jgi:hypothetical protein